MNNQFNNYNNQYNNQNNMYNDPYNNQFNQFNNMGMQQPYNHQKVPYINNNDNRGGGFFSFLIALILLIVCSALLLHFTGIYDLSEYFPILDKFSEVETNNSNNDDEDNNQSTDEEENKDDDSNDNDDSNLTAEEIELKSMCSLVDSNGNYTKDENNLCVDNVCVIFSEEVGYTYDCNTNEHGRMELDEIKVEAFLNTACANISAEGNYSNSEMGLSCTDYVCNYNYKNENYTKVCIIE